MRSVLLIMSILVLAACNNPLDKTYNSVTYTEDLEKIAESEKISFEDMELLKGYITLSKFTGNELEGLTYEELLERIKDVRKANRAENEQQNSERESLRQRLGPFVSVSMPRKTFSRSDNRDMLNYTIAIKNTSAKEIKMIIGSISLNDLLDREIKNIQVVLDEPLKVNDTVQKILSEEYRHNNEADKQVRLKDLVDLRVQWNPLKIIFQDGTIAE